MRNKETDAINSLTNQYRHAKEIEINPPFKFKGNDGSGHFLGGKEVYGIFDGQIMISADNRQYPVPANYASKSRLVEGDQLKLVITDEGDFLFKQVGPVFRKRFIGKMISETGVVDPKTNIVYQVLTATATYMKLEADDEVVAIIPRDNIDAKWAAIENIISKPKKYDDQTSVK